MTSVFEEVRRVLRKDGTLWLNCGDSYAGSNQTGGTKSLETNRRESRMFKSKAEIPSGLKPKDLCGVPWRLAFALQAAGWWLRCDIIWHKPNPMPESCEDRPTHSHEYIFLMTKSERYWYDAEAIKDPISESTVEWGNGKEGWGKSDPNHRTAQGIHGPSLRGQGRCGENGSTRNKRSVWTVPSAPYSGAHFATFPPKLITPCILAGCPAQTCPKCGMPWERIVGKGPPDIEHQRACGGDRNGEYFGKATKDFDSAKAQNASAVKARILAGMVEKKTLGWRPTCKCDCPDTVPGVVLDPFAGSGTTGKVALEYGRRAILIELNPEYVKQIEQRTETTLGLPVNV